jgi:predicted esterase
LIVPQGIGNNVRGDTRCGVSVLGALAMMQRYKFDSSRVYCGGLSGGARMACALGFSQSDLFSGTIQNCGADFYHKVAQRYATSQVDTLGFPYGVLETTPAEVAAAKGRVRFTLITGPNDFRYGNLRDLYEFGFKPEGFHAKLIDVPGMGHQNCDGATLDQALNFIEGRSK